MENLAFLVRNVLPLLLLEFVAKVISQNPFFGVIVSFSQAIGGKTASQSTLGDYLTSGCNALAEMTTRLAGCFA